MNDKGGCRTALATPGMLIGKKNKVYIYKKVKIKKKFVFNQLLFYIVFLGSAICYTFTKGM